MAQTANPFFTAKKNGNLEALDIFTSCENSHKFKQAEQNAEGKFAGCRQDVVHTVYTQNVVKSEVTSLILCHSLFQNLTYSNSNMPSVQECM